MNLLDKSKLTNGILSFIRRHTVLLITFALALLFVILPTPFHFLGMIVYLPLLTSGAMLSAVVLRHVLFHSTLSEDAHSGSLIDAFRSLPPTVRMYINWTILMIMYIGACIIAAALVR